MAIYTMNLFGVMFFSCLADRCRSRSGSLNLHGEKKPLIWFVLYVILSLSLVAGLRFLVGTDYVNYSILYEDARTNFQNVIGEQQIEVGYAALSALFGRLFEAPFVFFFFVSAFTNAMFILALRDSSKIFWFSCALYLLGFFFYSSFNLIRQFMALAIVFWAHRYLAGGKFWHYGLCVLAASLFHTSVLIMLPVYFIVRRPAWSWVIWLAFGATAAFLVFYDATLGLLFSVLGNTRYASYEELMRDGTDSVNVLRILVAALPVVLAFVCRRRIREVAPDANIVVNMTAIALMLSIIAYKQIYFARMSLYFSIYYLLLLPLFPAMFKDRRMRAAAVGTIFVCYLAYCYIMMPREASILPYQTIFAAPPDWNVMDYIFTR